MRWNWTKPLAVAVLLVGAGAACFGQAVQFAGKGSVAGKLTDLHSVPLGGVAVVLRNLGTGAEARTTTERNGTYRFSGLGPGEYALEAESPVMGRAEVGGIIVAEGHESRVQAAVRFDPLLPPPTEAAKPIPAVFPVTETARGLRDLNWEMPETVSPSLGAMLESEPIQPLHLRERQVPELVREKPQTEILALNARLTDEPMQALALSGRRWPAATLPGPQAALAGVANAPPPLTNRALQQMAGAAEVGLKSSANRSLAFGLAAAVAVQAALDFEQIAASPVRRVAPDSDPVGPAVTTTVTGEQLQALPSSGRHWQDFVLETPTAASPPEGDGEISLRGTDSASFTVDGAGKALAFGASGAGQGGGWPRGRGVALSEAAIREVQTTAGNVEAAGPRAAGGRVLVETMRGVNVLHGQGFLFDRQNTWGARNPFTQWVMETAPATLTTSPVFTPESYTPSDHEMTWGVGAGSHIRRDKLFWFGALDSYRRNDPGVATVKHPDQFFGQPSNDQMQVLSARLGLSSVNPVAAGLAAYSTMLEELGGLLGPAPRTAAQWTGFARIDWEVAERHRFTLEGTGADWNSPGGGLSRTSETYGSRSFGSSHAREEWLLGRWQAFLTPNLLAVTQASAGRTVLSARAETPSDFEQTLSQKTWGQLPQIVVDSRYGFTIGNPSRFGTGSYPDEHLYQVQETAEWVHGGLQLKGGLEVSHNSDWTSFLGNQTGTYYYANVENFVSDALAFAAFGVNGQLDLTQQHNCDQTGSVWRDTVGQLRGLGYLPCYSYYSQSMGPTDWHLSTNDWAGYATGQWQPKKLLVLSAGLRWEREQLPPPIVALKNPDLPLTKKMPSLGNDWGPRFSLAFGTSENHLPVLRMGYGMYFGRTKNATLETVLTQTGSLNGDLNFFMRPTDNLNAGGAPPFPYVLAGEPANVVKPGAMEFAPSFHNSEIHQAVTALDETLPGHVRLEASAMVSLGRRLPISIDANIDPSVNPKTITYGVVDGLGKGPIKTSQITVPFYASWPSATSETGFGGRLNPNYQQIGEIMSRANSTYEAATLKISRYGRRGWSANAHYTYAHAMDWNPNETSSVTGSDVLDPEQFSQEYGTSNLDVRHSGAATLVWEAPWKLPNLAGRLGNGWALSGGGHFHSGMPFSMRTAGSLPKLFDTTTGAAIVGLGPGMNGSGGDNRIYSVGRNTYRYPLTWKADLRLAKGFDMGHMRKLELLAESFNLFNHQNVTQLETVGYYITPGTLDGGLPTMTFLTGLKADTTEFGQPLNINATNFYRERQLQVGMRVRF